jgi:hypothetical protein
MEQDTPVPEELLRRPHALKLWVYLREHPNASLAQAGADLNITRRWASEIEKWLVLRGFLVEVRYGNGTSIIHERQVAIPGEPQEHRKNAS